MSVILVPPDYPLDISACRIAAIAQNPGKTEIDPNVLKPLSGYSGNLLKRWWDDLGIRREEIYLDNLIPYLCDPDKLDKKELDHWAGELHKRLSMLPGLNVIVAMGDYACKALTGKGKCSSWKEKKQKGQKKEDDEEVGIMRLRGSIYPYTTLAGRSCKVIPTLHPSACFDRGSRGQGVTKYILERRVIRDWQRIVYESKTNEINEPKRNHYICQSEKMAKWFIDRLGEVERRNDAVMSIDVETSEQLECVGFSFDSSWSFTFPTLTRKDWEVYSPYISSICSSPIPKVLQNGLYDTYWLRYYGIQVTNYIWDLMYAHGIIAPTDNHSLDYLSSVYLPFHKYWKDEAKSPEEIRKYLNNKEALYAYNGMDNCIQRELFDYILHELNTRNLTSFYFSHVALLLEPLLETSLAGIQVNKLLLNSLRELGINNIKEIREQLALLAGEDLVAKSGFSPIKLMKYFHETLGLPKVFKLTKKKEGKSKSATLDAMALAKLANAYPAKALKPAQLIVDYRSETKEIESWLNEDKLDGDGRVRCQYSPTTEAGRLSSKSNPRGTGYNLQNTKTREKAWRRDKGKENIRSIYLPDNGCLLVEVDLSQVEDRECKMYTRAKRMVELANLHPAEFDVHTHNAEIVFGKDYIKGDKAQRFMGKKVSHGSERGMSGKKLSDQLLAEEDMIVSPVECQKMIDTFLMENWEIRDIYFPWVREEIMTKGYLVNSWGRVWDVRGENFNDDLYRRGYSFEPQSEAADLMNQWGYIPIYHFLKCNYQTMKSRINIQRHDALIMSVPFEYTWDVAKFTLDTIERPREIMGNWLTVPATVKVGVNDAEGIEFKRLPNKADFLNRIQEWIKCQEGLTRKRE